MITVTNGSDKPITVQVSNQEYDIGTGMQPQVIPRTESSIVVEGIYLPNIRDFDEIIYCGKNLSVAGVKYALGEKVKSGALYVTRNGLFALDAKGELNNYSFFGNMKMLTVINECSYNIRVGATSSPTNVLRCKDSTLLKPGQSELYIKTNDKEYAINLSAILASYPSTSKIIITEDATNTTYKMCNGQYDTQDLTVMYITLGGKIYLSGKCIYCPYSWFLVIVIIVLILIAIIMFIGGLLFIKNKST